MRLSGEAREDHGDVIAGVLVAGAGNHHAVAVDLAAVFRRAKRQGHFCPRREGRGTSKFDSVPMEDN